MQEELGKHIRFNMEGNWLKEGPILSQHESSIAMTGQVGQPR